MNTQLLSNSLPPKIRKQILRWNFLFFISVLILLASWICALFIIGAEKEQGDIYGIMFVHVPVAWCAFFWIFMGAIFGVCVLLFHKKAEAFDYASQSSMEIGTIFSVLVLVTGSIWGRPTWGVWWDWDPRLTSSLVMLLIACGYLIFRQATEDLIVRRKMSAIITILCAVNVPIVYYSVNIWRSLHQPQTFVQTDKNASSDVTMVLFFNFVAMTIFSLCLYKIRRQSISAYHALEQARKDSDAGA